MKRPATLKTPFVVARDQIPLATDSHVSGMRARPFVGHEQMGLVASAGADLSWLEASEGEQVPHRSRPEPTLLIVMRGGALLLADVERRVAAGDVVTLPGGQSYGFTDIEGDLHVLQVALGTPLRRGREPEELTLERLLALNRKRAEEILESPFYVLLRNGLLDTSEKRAAACKAIRVFSDGFQMFLFTRQAMCRDESYASEFHGHMLEELGHNDLLQVSGNKRLMNDPILRACSAWFSQQMLTLDNAEKAVVNMALETSGFHFHTLAKPIFETGEHNRYFTTHAEADEDHQDMGVDLLTNLHPDVYRRLLEILDESWDMMVTVTTRFAELVESEVADASCAAQ